MHSLVHVRTGTQPYSKSARMSSFAELFAGPALLPLDGGVLRSGGSKYDNSSIGSTLSGRSCKRNNRMVLIKELAGELV